MTPTPRLARDEAYLRAVEREAYPAVHLAISERYRMDPYPPLDELVRERYSVKPKGEQKHGRKQPVA